LEIGEKVMRRFEALSALGLALFLVGTAGTAIDETARASGSPGAGPDAEFIREFVEVGLDRSVSGVRVESEEPGLAHRASRAQT
jgi:hypothetical protein